MFKDENFRAAQGHARAALKNKHFSQWNLAMELLKVSYKKRWPLTIIEVMQIIANGN